MAEFAAFGAVVVVAGTVPAWAGVWYSSRRAIVQRPGGWRTLYRVLCALVAWYTLIVLTVFFGGETWLGTMITVLFVIAGLTWMATATVIDTKRVVAMEHSTPAAAPDDDDLAQRFAAAAERRAQARRRYAMGGA